ncbi:MAG: c-type cytochrome [Thermoanaerobaculia bacterium]|nr:c-type cytochrome [Thermoanaerobaculia bacterium]
MPTNRFAHPRAPGGRAALPVGLLAGLLALAAGPPGAAEEAATYFRQNCMSCHTIGGGRTVGPDLKHVAERKDAAWLEAFIVNPKAKLDAGDPYALQLKEEARGAIMPPIAGMTPEIARSLLAFVAAESALPKSQFAGLEVTDEPFAAADLERGRALFRGGAALANGGPNCLSCHTVRGLGGLGGGRLAPDLTKVYERLQGRRNLASWLQAPATPTMRPLFVDRPLTNEEILPLVAFLEEAARAGGEDNAPTQPTFLLLGLGAAAVGLVAADAVWRRRLRAVRRPLVGGRHD